MEFRQKFVPLCLEMNSINFSASIISRNMIGIKAFRVRSLIIDSFHYYSKQSPLQICYTVMPRRGGFYEIPSVEAMLKLHLYSVPQGSCKCCKRRFDICKLFCYFTLQMLGSRYHPKMAWVSSESDDPEMNTKMVRIPTYLSSRVLQRNHYNGCESGVL